MGELAISNKKKKIPSCYQQASNEPVVPRDTVDPLFRPVNFLVPFTPQQGEITGVTLPQEPESFSLVWLCRDCFIPNPNCHLVGEVRMPSGKTARPHITDNKDGTITIKYQPTERGLHEMDIKYEGNHIPGEPSCFVLVRFWTTFCLCLFFVNVFLFSSYQKEVLFSSLWTP